MKEAAAEAASAASESLQTAVESAASMAESISPLNYGEADGEKEKTPVQQQSPPASSETPKGKKSKKSSKAAEKASVEPEKDADDKTVAKAELNGNDKVKVEVDSAVEVNGDTETTHTHVTVEMPAGAPELPLPEDTEAMIENAKRMVEEARALDAQSSSQAPKRKADDAELDEVDTDSEALPSQPAKKARVLEEKLKRERVRSRALIGISATLALG